MTEVKKEKAESSQLNNLELWDIVKTTDPEFTKGFSKGGGFKGTSINPTYNTKKATNLFGPFGIGWGVDVVGQSFQDGHLILIEGTPICREIIHIVQINFWYKWKGEKGNIPAFGQTSFVGQNKNGLYTDEEAPKKSLTDAITKAMSMLGFSADIFTGLYDDVKYINDIRGNFNDDGTIKGGVLDSDTRNEAKLMFLKQINEKMDAVGSLEDLEKAFTPEEKKYWKEKLPKEDPEALKALKKRYDNLLSIFSKQEAAEGGMGQQ